MFVWPIYEQLKKDFVNSQELIVLLKAFSQIVTVQYYVYSDHSSNSRITIDIKPNSSPDLSPSSGPGPVALITTATNRANNQPTDGDISIKTEVDQRTEGVQKNREKICFGAFLVDYQWHMTSLLSVFDQTGSEHKQWRSINRRHFVSF